MTQILVLSSKERYALLILIVLAGGEADVDTFETDLDLKSARKLYGGMSLEQKLEWQRAVSMSVDMSAFEDAQRPLADEELSWRKAIALQERFEALQALGGKDFGDCLLAGPAAKLDSIRKGNKNALLYEMAKVYRANEMLREARKNNKAVFAMLDGVDSLRAIEFFGSLGYEHQCMLDTAAKKLAGLWKKPKQSPRPSRRYEQELMSR
ncbi:hypothetical protein HQ524_00645 [Candidatus Uhrbacteria bacterium]|nr:hypothetical protein [Candidatus Uhrbacteria bacterium]